MFKLVNIVTGLSSGIVDFMNVSTLLNMYILCSKVYQAKCFAAHQVKTYCNENKIEITEAPDNDHCPIGLLERPILTINIRLACIKEDK